MSESEARYNENNNCDKSDTATLYVLLMAAHAPWGGIRVSHTGKMRSLKKNNKEAIHFCSFVFFFSFPAAIYHLMLDYRLHGQPALAGR